MMMEAGNIRTGITMPCSLPYAPVQFLLVYPYFSKPTGIIMFSSALRPLRTRELAETGRDM